MQDDVVNLEISLIKLCETDWYLDGQYTEASASGNGLIMTRALEMAQGMEAAAANSKDLKRHCR